ncbi:hypothetical protein V7087_25925 [Neobacillus niacini]|uniref:hypothetical protein n=1 Tax=Neobacillus niacini TaxID=86668 RepID=UPI002FFE0E9F
MVSGFLFSTACIKIIGNRSLDKTEDLSIIEVLDLDENKGIMSDISFKVTYNQMVTWLEKMNSDPSAAKQ